MDLQTQKDLFESYLQQKSHFYFKENNSLNEAIKYSLLAPGKRIRPLLSIGFALGFNGQLEMSYCTGMAVEMIHAYSLIHDDLPSIDNDDFRRGMPTNHKVFGEATAILAGDSLLNFSSEFLLVELSSLKIKPEKVIELVTLLMKSSGHKGMIKGQSLDMYYQAQNLKEYDSNFLNETLRNIHLLKTGSIITWSCLSGLYTSNSQIIVDKYKKQVEEIGQKIGLLFQMIDDVLDETASLEQLGKTPGKDKIAGKMTYSNLLGTKTTIELSNKLAQELRSDIDNLKETQGNWSIIKEILDLLTKKLVD
jgi:geranylgeranyl diphosphate synthase type II